MSDGLYITSSCKIDQGQVFKDAGLTLTGGSGGTEWLTQAYKHFGFDYPKFYRMDNLSKLGWLAAEILLEDGRVKAYRPGEVGIVLANKSSSLDTDIKYYESTRTIASPALFVYTLPNIVMGEISIRHRLKGENALFVSDHFETGFIHEYVSGLFAEEAIQCCICGWIEFMGQSYETILYLVEKTNEGTKVPFTEESIKKLYQLRNGEING